MFDPRCIFCGGRLLQAIPRYSGTTAEATQRRRAVLADWIAAGHQESMLRELAKGKMALEPIVKESKK
ncbi:MAG TPA: hypothetical protein VD994_19895 [Prosthecobacter sp.]|nr:hypothetical protein [Prosthecobacter sp.]